MAILRQRLQVDSACRHTPLYRYPLPSNIQGVLKAAYIWRSIIHGVNICCSLDKLKCASCCLGLGTLEPRQPMECRLDRVSHTKWPWFHPASTGVVRNLPLPSPADPRSGANREQTERALHSSYQASCWSWHHYSLLSIPSGSHALEA